MEQDMPCNVIKTVPVLARRSNLSRAQVREVFEELSFFYPGIACAPLFMDTAGDLDKKSSLRTREKSNFFTFEIDEWQRENRGFVAIHSAKDLPDPLPSHLMIAALTKGVDSSDSLVFRDYE